MSSTPLLPERHPNNDFFIADICDSLPFKDDRHTMEHPFFALSTKKSTETIKYAYKGTEIKLSPSAEFGLPTMMDKDILLYCGSLMMNEKNELEKRIKYQSEEIRQLVKEEKEKEIQNSGELENFLDEYVEKYKEEQRFNNPVPRTIRFSCHDLMVTTNRQTNGQSYKLLKNAFERLTGCLITTNIKTNKIEETKGFHMIESYQILNSSHAGKRMVRVEVTVSDWFYNSLMGGEVYTINRKYFRLRKPLERRLYELARKFCGHQSEWSIGLEKLKARCGSRSDLNQFRYQLNQIIEGNKGKSHLPDYTIVLSKDDIVTFKNLKRMAIQDNFFDLPTLKKETIDRGAKIVLEAGTGWDYNAIREQFVIQLQAGFAPQSVDGAFINFVKKKVLQRP